MSDNDLGRAGRAGIDVSACGITTYGNTANAVPNFLCNLTTLQGKFFWPKLLTNDDNTGIMIEERKRELNMRKSVSVKSFTRSLPPIYTHDFIVRMKDGKAYRLSRCSSDRQAYETMRSNGFDTKDIVRVDIAPKK